MKHVLELQDGSSLSIERREDSYYASLPGEDMVPLSGTRLVEAIDTLLHRIVVLNRSYENLYYRELGGICDVCSRP